ncbi:Ribosomal RNA-processing protein 12 [Vitis vinifera]|uniref:Ribosomal RNA-processing protein 12 n=1 Tax=Vitis vinifera TaxID=29760 RepID=A0A438C056_VITVI|nr:Ribosomal RNA-processing protein 12 [Vitis vinifera]
MSVCYDLQLQECIGSAVTALGPERILTLLPISLDAENFTCSNIWLVPILNKYVVGASLRYFMEHIMPLAESFKRASHKVKKSVIGEDLQAHAHGLWGLLPVFCRYPTDTCQSFLNELVNQNRSILRSSEGDCESNTYAIKDSMIQSSSVASYSEKTATKNIGALASCSMELLQALTDLFFGSPPEKRSYLKDAIGCLASISDSSITKRILISSLERLELINGVGEFENVGNSSTTEKDTQR